MSAEWSKKAFQKFLLSLILNENSLKAFFSSGRRMWRSKNRRSNGKQWMGLNVENCFKELHIIGTHHSCRKYLMLLFLSPKCGSTLCSFRPWTHLPFSPLLMAFYTQPKIRGFSSINFMRRRKNLWFPLPLSTIVEWSIELALIHSLRIGRGLWDVGCLTARWDFVKRPLLTRKNEKR